MSLMNLGEAMDKVLQAIADQASLKEACHAAGVSPGAHYHWLKSDVPYQEGYKLALRIRARGLEDTLNRRSVEGYDERKVTYTLIADMDGNVVKRVPVEEVVTHKYDNNLALRMLAANDERYNPKAEVRVDHSRVSIEEILAAARNRLAAAREEPNDNSKA